MSAVANTGAEAVAVDLVHVRLTSTIANEYLVRSVFGEAALAGDPMSGLPGGPAPGARPVPRAVAQAMLDDAEFQLDPDGPFGQPRPEDLGVRSAYRALVRQLRQVLG